MATAIRKLSALSTFLPSQLADAVHYIHLNTFPKLETEKTQAIIQNGLKIVEMLWLISI